MGNRVGSQLDVYLERIVCNVYPYRHTLYDHFLGKNSPEWVDCICIIAQKLGRSWMFSKSLPNTVSIKNVQKFIHGRDSGRSPDLYGFKLIDCEKKAWFIPDTTRIGYVKKRHHIHSLAGILHFHNEKVVKFSRNPGESMQYFHINDLFWSVDRVEIAIFLRRTMECGQLNSNQAIWSHFTLLVIVNLHISDGRVKHENGRHLLHEMYNFFANNG